MLGDKIGLPHADHSDLEMQSLGLRVKYLANQIDGHTEALDAALTIIEAQTEEVGQ